MYKGDQKRKGKEHSFEVNFIMEWCKKKKKDDSWFTSFQFIKKCILEDAMKVFLHKDVSII